MFDGLDAATGSRKMRDAADATLTFGVLGAFAAAATGLSDWRYLSGVSRRMGLVHGRLNGIGLLLIIFSVVFRFQRRRNAGWLAFLAGYTVSGTAAHLGGELSDNYGLWVNRNAFEWAGPDEFTPVLDEDELPEGDMQQIALENGARILVSRVEDGSICAISDVCSHFAGPLADGEREGDKVICPWHKSRFDLCTGQVIDGPTVFPQSRWETRVRDGKIEVKGAEENIQKAVR